MPGAQTERRERHAVRQRQSEWVSRHRQPRAGDRHTARALLDRRPNTPLPVDERVKLSDDGLVSGCVAALLAVTRGHQGGL